MINYKFKKSQVNICVFIRESIHKSIIALYVDNCVNLIALTCYEGMELIISELCSQLEIIINMQKLGLEVEQKDADILVYQTSSIKKLLNDLACLLEIIYRHELRN